MLVEDISEPGLQMIRSLSGYDATTPAFSASGHLCQTTQLRVKFVHQTFRPSVAQRPRNVLLPPTGLFENLWQGQIAEDSTYASQCSDAPSGSCTS